MKRKPKDPTNKLAKNSIQPRLFPSCARPTKKGNRKHFFFGILATSNVQKEREVRNNLCQLSFYQTKRRNQRFAKRWGEKFQTIFKATAKILHHRLPHKVRQSGGFYIYFFFFWLRTDDLATGFSLYQLQRSVARKLPNHVANSFPIPHKKPLVHEWVHFLGESNRKVFDEALPRRTGDQ